MRPLPMPADICACMQAPAWFLQRMEQIRLAIQRLNHSAPDVSIIIPAYNEEQNLLRTLFSLSRTSSKRSIEIIVVDNNSTDSTSTIASMTGVICLKEEQQGVKHARNKGLTVARGKYVLNADSDTVYPPAWIDAMIEHLQQDENAALVYGKFAFLSTTGRPRLWYYCYELIGDVADLP